MTKIISLPINIIQAKLDRIGMYRVVTLALLGILACSLVAGGFGWLSYSPAVQLMAVAPAVALALLLNIAIAKLKRIPANHESAIITALILFFLVIPANSLFGNWALFSAVFVAILSKYFITYRKQHIFNAAAFGAVVISLPGWYEFSWWVSNPTLFFPVLIFGMLVVMKIRKWTPVLWFIAVGLVVYMVETWALGLSLLPAFNTYFLSWPTLFLAFLMLTEPFTLPPTKKQQALYGGLVGFLANTTLFEFMVAMSPELALVIGNLAVYPYRMRRKLFLKLISKREIAKDIYEFTFQKPDNFKFEAGQYLEWMLPHEKPDSRGTRRYFTIASSPTESVVRLALKFVPNGSSYKDQLKSIDIGDIIIASQLAGDFTLPKRPEKLGFIAGGIGVTPFSSHLRYLADTGQSLDIKLFYCVNTVDELAFQEEFEKLSDQINLELIPVIAKEPVKYPYEHGFITKEMLANRCDDYQDRHWYLSGPPPMVDAYNKLLTDNGVKKRKITKDFFPGLA